MPHTRTIISLILEAKSNKEPSRQIAEVPAVRPVHLLTKATRNRPHPEQRAEQGSGHSRDGIAVAAVPDGGRHRSPEVAVSVLEGRQGHREFLDRVDS
jgi:hypothetical protein